jgi:hypothetical protein
LLHTLPYRKYGGRSTTPTARFSKLLGYRRQMATCCFGRRKQPAFLFAGAAKHQEIAHAFADWHPPSGCVGLAVINVQQVARHLLLENLGSWLRE